MLNFGKLDVSVSVYRQCYGLSEISWFTDQGSVNVFHDMLGSSDLVLSVTTLLHREKYHDILILIWENIAKEFLYLPLGNLISSPQKSYFFLYQ